MGSLKELVGTKSFWSGIAMIGMGVVQAANGDVNNGIQSIIGGISIIFIRDAIRTKEPDSK